MVLPIPKEALKLLFAGQLKWEEGQIKLLGISMLLSPVDFFEHIARLFNKKEDVDKIYIAGWTAGYEVTKKLMLFYKLETPQERYTIAMNGVEMGGFGKYKTIKFMPGVISHFRYYNNPFPKRFFKTDQPVCHFIRGFNAGGGTWVHKMLVNCIELTCAAVNGQYCEFINFTYSVMENILYEYKTIIIEQFDNLKNILEFQLNYIKNKKDDRHIKAPSKEELEKLVANVI